jgi:hypothetical protein
MRANRNPGFHCNRERTAPRFAPNRASGELPGAASRWIATTGRSAQHRHVPAGDMPDIIRPRRKIEKGHVVAAVNELFRAVGADQAGTGN